MKYDFIVIGGGSAGLVAAKLAKGLGRKTAIVEGKKLGGDCTHFGCIPSKTLLRASHMADDIKNLKDLGLKMDTSTLDTSNVMSHVRQVVSAVYLSETPEVIRKEGIDVIEGFAEFVDNHTILVNGEEIWSNQFLLATGSSPYIPPIEGLSEVDYLTNETILNLDKLPASVAILGGGPIGVELASALNGLGVDTALVEMSDRILPKEDEELSELLRLKLIDDDIKIITGTKIVSVAQNDGYVTLNAEGALTEIKAERILVAVGRKPNIDGLKLENAGINYKKRGFVVSPYMQTTVSNIYAAGDIASEYQFTHVADYEAVTATRNALLPMNKAADYADIGWCIYTEPELARCGLTEKEAIEKFGEKNIKVYKYGYGHVDRAVTDGNTSGLAKYITDKKGYLLGIHLLGTRAGEVIHEPMLAKKFRIPFHKISEMVHIYPTYAYAVRQPSKYAAVSVILDNPIVKFLRGFKK